MPFRPSPSLLAQTGLIIGLITLLAIIGISSSFFVTKTIQGTGTAINASGALRMLSHKIGTQMMHDNQQQPPDPSRIEQVVIRFEQQLNHPALQELTAKGDNSTTEQKIFNLYRSILDQWENEMRPLLISYTAFLGTLDSPTISSHANQAAINSFHRIYLTKVDTFVNEIDRMVNAVEERTESQIQLLHDIEYISLLLLLMAIIAAPFLFQRKILLPLKDLLKISKQVRQRDFSSQVQYHRPDELGELAQAFNLMISDLSATYTELEERITDKTDALIEESNRITLLEERNAIAQELHDSLAQSIFYLNIQITRLNTLVKQQASQAQLTPVIEELKETNTITDHQLRELISTFRIQINPEGLNAAIEEIIQRQKGRYPVTITFNNQIPDLTFSHNEEVHLIQIIQEAVSNIVKHAKASSGTITLSQDATENLINLSIIDNGVGIPVNPHRPNHFGLRTMEERAAAIHGRLEITPNSRSKGTCITLQFSPALNQESPL